jgi:N-acetylneuraminic acid mutarotase
VKPLAGLLAAMSVVFGVAILAYAGVINLPGNWRTELGFAEAAPNLPCRLGLYRKDPPGPAVAGRWRLEPEAPKAQVEGSAVAIGPVIYIAGGSRPGNLRTVLAYDTRTGGWSEPTRLPVGLNHSQVVAHRGDLYLAGGYLEGDQPSDELWRYDPRANSWTRLPSMPQARGAAGAAVIGDKLYIVDGAPKTYYVDNPRGPYGNLEIYDFKRRSWSIGPDAPVAVHHVGAAALGGRLYLAGGRTDPQRSTDGFYSYDPGTATWKRLPALPTGPISSLGTVAARGELVVFGGDDELGWEGGGGSVSATAWAFDPARSRWRRLPDLNIERHAFGAAVARGRIYAIAGSYCPGLKPNGPVGTHTVESLPTSVLKRG